MPSLPPSFQVLDKHDRVVRWSHCPVHKKRTHAATGFIGVSVTPEGKGCWLWRCSETDHVFAALPDRTAPKPGEEQKWVAEQKLKRVVEPTKSLS